MATQAIEERTGCRFGSDDGERRGVVWVTLVKLGEGALSVPMPGVPRIGEVVELGGEGDAHGERWRVVQVIWKAPVGLSESALPTLNRSELPPVKVYLKRVPAKA